jgi:hypothetical protein
MNHKPKKKLNFKEEVFGFKQQNDPNQRARITERSYHTGTILVPYKGTIIGIRKMLNGDVFYTIEANEINIFEREFPIIAYKWEQKIHVEIISKDIFFSESELDKGIRKKVGEFRAWAKEHLDNINLNKTTKK